MDKLDEALNILDSIENDFFLDHKFQNNQLALLDEFDKLFELHDNIIKIIELIK